MVIPDVFLTTGMSGEAGPLAHMQGFARCQLDGIRPEEILANTAALVTACAFFRGAWSILAAGRRYSDDDRVLAGCLQAWFSLPEDNARGLLHAVAGLVRRYRYLAVAEELGRRCARAWAEGAGKADLLADYLRRHAHITMAELGFAGVTEDEALTAAARGQGRFPPHRQGRRRRLAWAAFLLAAAAALGWVLWHGGPVEMPW